jgi:hypothetical protein
VNDLDTDRCGIGRCKNPSSLIGNGVPMCDLHWHDCCDSGLTTYKWLKKKARTEWRREIIDPSEDSELGKMREGIKIADKEPTKPVKLRRRRRTGMRANS